MKRLLGGIVVLLLLAESNAAQTQPTRLASDAPAQKLETYESAAIDASGSLRITTSDRRTIVVPKEGDQSSFRNPTVSPDRTAVGAQADSRVGEGAERMAEVIRQVEYFYIEVSNKVGEGAKVLQGLKDAGVNLVAFSGFPAGRRAQLDFFPADASAFKAVAKANRWKLVGPKRGFLVQGDDRIGAVADLLGKLAEANIGVIALDAVSIDGRYGALCWVAPRDVKKAAKLLGAA